MKKDGRGQLTSSVVEAALALGDEVMEHVLAEAQYYLGLHAGGIANLLDPEVIVIGGGIVERLGERFVAPIRARAYKHFLAQRDREQVRIVPMALNDLAAPLGAAWVARQRARQSVIDSASGARQGTATWPVPSA
jgi:glucokinase